MPTADPFTVATPDPDTKNGSSVATRIAISPLKPAVACVLESSVVSAETNYESNEQRAHGERLPFPERVATEPSHRVR
jgi:hypothetical protein